MLCRMLRLLGDIHLSGFQPRQQLIGGDIDQHHFIGGVEHLVGHGLPDAHVGDPANHIVEAFQMLHVQRAEYIDARRQQLIDILPALRMTRTGHIGMRQLVHQDQLRVPRKRRVQVEFEQRLATILNGLGRQNFQALQQRGSFHTAVGLDHADQDPATLARQLARRDQHGVGFAHARR